MQARNSFMGTDFSHTAKFFLGIVSWRIWKSRIEILICLAILLSIYKYFMRGSIERIIGNSNLSDENIFSIRNSPIDTSTFTEEEAQFLNLLETPLIANNTSLQLENKVYNIRFFKLHKCSSTTIQIMLIRFAESHRLSLAIPRGDIFLRDIVSEIPRKARTPNNIYNMLVHHASLNKQLEMQVLHPNTVYFTMMRDPIDRFVSQYMWFRKTPGNIDKLGDVGINEYVLKFLQPKLKDNAFYKELNFMATYLGYFRNFQSLEIPQEAFQEWDQIFDLVMITEYFDESLVFLKELLNWNEEEMVTFDMNKRIKEENDSLLSEQAKGLLDEWTTTDRQLYTYYRSRFEQKVKDYGENRMEERVAEMKSVRETWASRCINKSGGNLDTNGLIRHKHSRRNDSVVHEITQQGLSYPLCIRALTTEFNYKILMKLKQARLIAQYYKFPD